MGGAACKTSLRPASREPRARDYLRAAAKGGRRLVAHLSVRARVCVCVKLVGKLSKNALPQAKAHDAGYVKKKPSKAGLKYITKSMLSSRKCLWLVHHLS